MISRPLYLSFSKYRNEIISLVVLIALSVLLQLMGAANILDTRLYYSAAEASNYFASLTDQQTQRYKMISLVDLFLYIPAYTSLLYSICKRLLPPQKIWISFVPAAFDIFETSIIFLFLAKFINEFPGWLGFVTALKWHSGFAIGAGIIVVILKKRAA